MWTAPDPRLGATVELAGGERGCRLKLRMVGEALAREGIPSKEPPPALDQIEPAGPGRKRLDVHAGMLNEPLLDGCTLVAGAVVGDQGAFPVEVGLIHGVEQGVETGGVAGERGLRENLAITWAQHSVDPDLVGTTTLVKGGFDAMAIRRPARCRGERARAHRSELVEAEDRRSLRRVGREGDDPRSFGTNSGSVLSAQLRGCRHRTPSFSRMRRIWLRSTGIPFSRAARASPSKLHWASCSGSGARSSFPIRIGLPGGTERARAMMLPRSCSVSRGLRPTPGRSLKPSSPSALNRMIRSRTVWG